MDKVNAEEEGLINRKQNKEFSACKNYIPVVVEPYPQTKLKKIDDNRWLFNKDSTLYPVMYKIHESLNGAKTCTFTQKGKMDDMHCSNMKISYSWFSKVQIK